MVKLSISKAWEEASGFLSRESRLVTPIALAMFTVPTALYGWYNPSGDPNQASAGLGWPLTLLALVLTVMGQMAIAGMAIGWSGRVGDVLAHASKRVWGVLGAMMLIFFPIGVLLFFAMAVLIGRAGITDPTQITPQVLEAIPGLPAVVLGVMLVALFFAIRMFPSSALGMAETGNPIRLISRSWALTKGHFWRLAATFMLVVIASMIASAAVTSVAGSAMALVAGEAQPFNVSALIVSLLDGAVSAIISSISAALVGRIYVQLAAGSATVPEVSRERQ